MANNKGENLRNQILALVFQAQNLPWESNTDLYISLHTSVVGTSGNQSTNEATYTGYSRVAIQRNSTNWNVTGNQVTNINDIEFPECTGGAQIITHAAIGTDASGAGVVLYQGPLVSSETVNVGNIPRIVAGALTLTET